MDLPFIAVMLRRQKAEIPNQKPTANGAMGSISRRFAYCRREKESTPFLDSERLVVWNNGKNTQHLWST